MGIKNKLNKMKSFLFDDEEEKETPKKEKLKKIEPKEERKEEPKEFINNKKNDFDDLYFEDISDNSELQSFESRSSKKDTEFNFPEFNDNDFYVATKEPEPIIPVKKEEVKVPLYQGSKRKEEIKKFTPSPIISPIYGLLDDEGNTVKKDNINENSYYGKKEEVTFDDIRKKAYGTLDDELENTLKRLSNKTIEEAEKEMEDDIKLSRHAKNNVKEVKKIKKAEVSNEEDDMILPNINLKEVKIDKKINSSYDEDDDDDTKEQDLFNLIDSMYAKEEKK